MDILFNKSFETGKVPDLAKLAKVVPIYKSKEKAIFSNYRPISLLPTFSQILKKIMHKRLYNFFVTNNLLMESQYGFRSSHSTAHAIAELYADILQGFDSKNIL